MFSLTTKSQKLSKHRIKCIACCWHGFLRDLMWHRAILSVFLGIGKRSDTEGLSREHRPSASRLEFQCLCGTLTFSSVDTLLDWSRSGAISGPLREMIDLRLSLCTSRPSQLELGAGKIVWHYCSKHVLGKARTSTPLAACPCCSRCAGGLPCAVAR